MADEVENHTIRLLQEMRDGIARLEARLEEGIEALRADVTDLTQRVDGNTLTFNLVAGVVYNHEERIEKLEQDRA